MKSYINTSNKPLRAGQVGLGLGCGDKGLGLQVQSLTWSLPTSRESLYRLLPQTTPENINKNFEQYTLDPGTRYPNLNSNCVRPHQVSPSSGLHPSHPSLSGRKEDVTKILSHPWDQGHQCFLAQKWELFLSRRATGVTESVTL